MFRGVNKVSIDAKNRVAVPARFREVLLRESEGKMVANLDVNQAPCLAFYPVDVWQQIAARVEQLPNSGDGAIVRRHILGNAGDVELDAGGRFLLPANLREQLQLDKKCVLVGLGSKLELWSEADWQANQRAAEDKISNPETIEQFSDILGYM